MQDVALQVGVSAATVSLALSGSPRISPATRAKVEQAAQQMGYRPHVGARALRTASTRTIGLVVSDVANPFFAELAGAIQRAAAERAYSLVLCNSDEDPDRQDDYLSSLLAGRQVDGVIVVPTAAMTPGLRQAGASGARMVLLDRPVEVTRPRGRRASPRPESDRAQRRPGRPRRGRRDVHHLGASADRHHRAPAPDPGGPGTTRPAVRGTAAARGAACVESP